MIRQLQLLALTMTLGACGSESPPELPTERPAICRGSEKPICGSLGWAEFWDSDQECIGRRCLVPGSPVFDVTTLSRKLAAEMFKNED